MRANPNELWRRFDDACRGLGTPDSRRREFDQLIAAYTAQDRYYHGIDHIADCLREFDSVGHLASDPQSIQLAIWFHDVVYDGRRMDNEELSADVADAALARLGATDELRDCVRKLIL